MFREQRISFAYAKIYIDHNWKQFARDHRHHHRLNYRYIHRYLPADEYMLYVPVSDLALHSEPSADSPILERLLIGDQMRYRVAPAGESFFSASAIDLWQYVHHVRTGKEG